MKNPLSSIIDFMHRHRPERIGRFVMPYLVVLLTVIAILGVVRVGELRHGLIHSCEVNGNPIREAVQGVLRQELKRSDPETIRKFFPQIPEAELNHLLESQMDQIRAQIEKLNPVDCSAQY